MEMKCGVFACPTLFSQLNDLMAKLPWNNPCIFSPVSDGCGANSLLGNLPRGFDPKMALNSWHYGAGSCALVFGAFPMLGCSYGCAVIGGGSPSESG